MSDEKIIWTTCKESEFAEKYPDGGVNQANQIARNLGF